MAKVLDLWMFPSIGSLSNVFKTSDTQIVTEIQLAFGFRPPSAIGLIADRVKTFCTKYESCDHQLHKLSQLPL